MEGVVLKSTGSWYIVRADNGKRLECRLRGKIRLEGLKSTNPIAVGDRVKLEDSDLAGQIVISKIFPRKNHIVRRSVNLSKQTHILAANIDCAIVLASMAHPETPLGLIDRFLATAEAYQIPAAVVFNKEDLLSEEGIAYTNELISIYEKIGYTSFSVSAIRGINLDKMRDLLKEKTSLVSGQSGVGKSSLINALDPNLNLKTAELSTHWMKGKHTTTFAEMHEISFGGYIIDTPGIREFGMSRMEKAEVAHYFPEMFALLGGCRFYNCLHINEPGCAVKEAVENGEIEHTRYRSYIGIVENEDLGVNYK